MTPKSSCPPAVEVALPEQPTCIPVDAKFHDRLILRIVSGGQTGADRAALDWAIANGLQHGGWCPEGRLAEDGRIPDRYGLRELPGAGYRARTKANVRDSDGTLIISLAPNLTGGSWQTAVFAKSLGKPCLHIHPMPEWQTTLQRWIASNAIAVLNVAGPRASGAPTIGVFVVEVLDELRRRQPSLLL